MHRVRCYGGTLASALPFPELATATTPVDWTLTVAEALPAPRDERPVARVRQGACDLALVRHADGLRLAHNCTGTFDVRDGGRTLLCAPAPHVRPERLRLEILGRVLALAAHERGELCLHASAVVVGDAAIVLVARKGSGKSTLAAALVRAGARLVGDDVVPVRTDAVPFALPGVHSLRLRDDAAACTTTDGMARRRSYDGKVALEHFDAHRATDRPAPLAAVYVIDPAPPEAPEAAVRTRLPALAALAALLPHGKLGALLGGSEAARQLHHLHVLATTVPVHTLAVARDLARLDAAAATVVSWHGPVAASREAKALAT